MHTFNSVVSRYRELSLPVKSSFWFMMCNFVQKCISMLTTPVFTRIMSEEQYGICGIFTSWSMIFEIIVSLCLSSCAMVLYTKLDNKEKILSTLTSLQVILGLFWIFIYLIAHRKISELLQMSESLCIALILSASSSQAIYLWMGYKRYLYEYKGSVGVTIVITVISSLFSAFSVVFISNSAAGRLIPMTIVNVGVAVFLYFLDLKKCCIIFDPYIWKFAFSFGIPLIPHAVSQFVLSVSDRLMINYMCGVKDVALYSVAGSIGAIFSMFTASINASFAPYQYQQIKNKNYKKLEQRADEVILLVAILSFGIMLFGNEIIFVFGGEKYIESTHIIVPVCLGAFFGYMFQLFARVQEYFLHKTTLVIASTLCAMMNVVMNYIFIGLYGYRAAAYTTFICYLFFCLIHYIFYKRVLRIDLNHISLYNIKHLALISLILIIFGFLIEWINQYLVVKYLLIVLVLILCVIKRKTIWNINKLG